MQCFPDQGNSDLGASSFHTQIHTLVFALLFSLATKRRQNHRGVLMLHSLPWFNRINLPTSPTLVRLRLQQLQAQASRLTLAVVALLSLSACQSLSTTTSTGTSSDDTPTRQEAVSDLFMQLDINGDGKLTRDEARSGFQMLVTMLDRPSKDLMMAAKSGEAKKKKRLSPRRPTPSDSKRAFDKLFESTPEGKESLTQEEFKKLVAQAKTDDPERDPFLPFL